MYEQDDWFELVFIPFSECPEPLFDTFKSLKAFVNWYKGNAPCADCGRTFHPACMEFDHIPERGPKIGIIKQFIVNRNVFELWKEIAKCEIVCSNCHKVRTVVRGTSQVTRDKISKSTLGRSKNLRWSRKNTHKSTDTGRAAQSKSLKIRWSDDSFRDKMSKATSQHMKSKWAEPGFREFMKMRGNGQRGPSRK